jgi:hypothetical protein
VRRRSVILPIVVLAGVLVALRRRRLRVKTPPLAAPRDKAALPPIRSATRFVSVSWTLLEAPASDARLLIRYRGDEHMELDRIDVQETPTQVFVTVLMRWRPPVGGGYAASRDREAGVALSGPLGDRELVHAPVDPDAPPDEPSGPPLYP